MPNLVPEKKEIKKNLMLIISPSAHSNQDLWILEFKLLNTKTFRIQDV